MAQLVTEAERTKQLDLLEEVGEELYKELSETKKSEIVRGLGQWIVINCTPGPNRGKFKIAPVLADAIFAFQEEFGEQAMLWWREIGRCQKKRPPVR